MSVFGRKYDVSLGNGKEYIGLGLIAEARNLAKSVEKNVLLSDMRGEETPLRLRRGSVVVNIWSVPENALGDDIPSAFGLSIRDFDCHFNALRPSGTLLTVYDEDGIPVAEFSEGAIYILFSLYKEVQQEELFQKISNEYIDFVTSGAKDYLLKMLERKEKAKERNLAGIYKEKLADDLDSATSELRRLELEIIGRREQLIQDQRERDYTLRKIDYLKTCLANFDCQKMVKIIESLKLVSATGDIEVLPDRIIVPVGQIDIAYDGETYDIGDFDIELYPNGNYGGVRCVNKTRSVEDYPHPHVDTDGSVCFGNIDDQITKLISQGEYPVVAQIMVDFLHTVNDEGSYTEVTNWPKKVNDQ